MTACKVCLLNIFFDSRQGISGQGWAGMQQEVCVRVLPSLGDFSTKGLLRQAREIADSRVQLLRQGCATISSSG